MQETALRGRVPGRAFYLAYAPALLLLACASCADRPGLDVGGVEIPYRLIAAGELSLRTAFPAEGRASLTWMLLDNGLAEEALLHARLPEASAAARAAADGWARRLRAGEEFDALMDEARTALPEQELVTQLRKPGPAFLGSSVAAAVAEMEPGEWRGPLRTERGWELVHLAVREPIPRSIAQVQVDRISFWIGAREDRERARADWARLPISGDPELLDALPLEFRRGRIPEASPRQP